MCIAPIPGTSISYLHTNCRSTTVCMYLLLCMIMIHMVDMPSPMLFGTRLESCCDSSIWTVMVCIQLDRLT